MGQRENVRRVECQIHRAAGNMGLVRLFTRNAAVALESEPTPVSTAPSTAPSTTPPTADSIAQSEAEPTAETESSSAVPIYVIRTDGIAVDLAQLSLLEEVNSVLLSDCLKDASQIKGRGC